MIGEQAEVHVYDATESRIQFSSNGMILTVRSTGGDQSIDLHNVPVVPHMFMNKQVLVVYYESDQAVLNLLTDLLGAQVAGP
jgi:archaellin